MNNRLYQLDSIRGLAALSVLLGHIVGITAVTGLIAFTPLRIFWLGHAAVILFFILSGFVLSLSYYGKKVHYPSFLLKRIFRIYFPYLVSIIFAVLLSKIIVNSDLSNLGRIDTFWENPATLKELFLHATLILNFDTNVINTVIWSLVHEMRISIIFPILMIAIIKFSWKQNIGLAFIFSMCGLLNHYFQFDVSKGFRTSIPDTIHYASFFIFGALLAKNIEFLQTTYKKLNFVQKTLLGVLSLLLYGYATSLILRILEPKSGEIISDWFIAGGVLIFIVMALSSEGLSKVLGKKVFTVLGDLSYSVYLYHFIILIALLNIFYGKINLIVIYLITIVISYMVAWISWKFVEMPCITLGRKTVNLLFKNTRQTKGISGKTLPYVNKQ